MMALLLEAATASDLASHFVVALALGGILSLLWMIESRLAEIKKLLEKK